ncbi:hypothetical protein KPL70_021275 [Citrus sinensis]|nr:hypothetical protein KPL70_021275 [Citrus sinensis]
MAYLHNELPGSITPHGHFKSSNVLLDKSFKRPLTDYAPRPLINPDNAHTLMAAYKSPQYAHNAKISKKSDIGLSCCEEDVLARMELKEVTEKIERLKEGGNDHDEHFCDGYVQSINGSGDGFFSHG